MLQLPPIPTWDGLHPLIIHFPIVLLLIAPWFVVAALIVSPSRARPLFLSALVLMVLGTISAFVSYETGEAAGKLADRTPEINATLQRHEQLAETTRLLFSVLTLLFAALLSAPKLFRLEPSRSVVVTVCLVFLAFYASGALVLVNTAHQGGTLVHQYGVQAQVSPGSGPPPTASSEHE